MKLPNPQHAVVPIEKLRDYCLNPFHPRGRHKARVFARALGLRAEHAELLRDALVAAAGDGEAVQGEVDEYGVRLALDFELEGPGGRAWIRSCWIVRVGEDTCRFLTCWVL
ncbi:MAG: hypothetical protein HZA54_00610 [Planctomycetes bacterium]|nr:hypothetical protein [Planctomycetota bacterium]